MPAGARRARPEDYGLIVTCSECSTSFQLDEARIPATGAQVRCSRCKHAFFLAHPSASEAGPVHGIAEAAAADPSAGVPQVSSDLGGLSSPGLGGTGSTDELEEEEWHFSEEVRVEGDEDIVDQSASGEGSGSGSGFGIGDDFGDGLDADAISADVTPAQPDAPHVETPAVAAMAVEDDGVGLGLELDGPPASNEVVRDESSFGSVDDFSSLMENDEPAATTAAAETSAAIEHPSDTSSGSYAGGGTTDDLGDPESWDLIGGAPASAPQSRVKRKTRSAQSPAGAAIDGALADLSFLPDPDSHAYEEDREPSAFVTVVGKFGHVVGWVVTLVALVVVTGLLVGPEFSRWADAPQTAALGPLRAQTNEMHWVETARSGFVLVMRGEVENAGTEAVLPDNVRLFVLDGAGGRLTAAPLQVGLPLAEEELREAGPLALRAQLDASVEAFASRPLAPGESLLFEAVVLEDALPTRARRILLEVADPNAEAPIAAGQASTRSISASGGPATAQMRSQDKSSAARGGSADPDAMVAGTHDSAGRVSDLAQFDD